MTGNIDYEEVWNKFQSGELTVTDLSKIVWRGIYDRYICLYVCFPVVRSLTLPLFLPLLQGIICQHMPRYAILPLFGVCHPGRLTS